MTVDYTASKIDLYFKSTYGPDIEYRLSRNGITRERCFIQKSDIFVIETRLDGCDIYYGDPDANYKWVSFDRIEVEKVIASFHLPLDTAFVKIPLPEGAHLYVRKTAITSTHVIVGTYTLVLAAGKHIGIKVQLSQCPAELLQMLSSNVCAERNKARVKLLTTR